MEDELGSYSGPVYSQLRSVIALSLERLIYDHIGSYTATSSSIQITITWGVEDLSMFGANATQTVGVTSYQRALPVINNMTVYYTLISKQKLICQNGTYKPTHRRIA